GAQRGGGTGEATDVEVRRDRPFPDRLLQNRQAVVGVLVRRRLVPPGPALERPRFVELRDALERAFAAQLPEGGIDVPSVARNGLRQVARGPHGVTTAARVCGASATAAAPIESQLLLTLRVGTTGSGGRLYFSGRSQSRKKAFSPPVPGWLSASAPYKYASWTPRACSSETRARAFTRNCTRSPNWMEPVGQCLAQAGVRSAFRRS